MNKGGPQAHKPSRHKHLAPDGPLVFFRTSGLEPEGIPVACTSAAPFGACPANLNYIN